MSLFSKSNSIRSPEFHKKKQKENFKKSALILFSFIILIFTPIYLFGLDRFQIRNIEIAGNDSTSKDELSKIIIDNLKGNYLLLFPKSNALIYPKNKILNDITSSIPRIENINISLQNPTSIKVSVVERKPVGLYCKELKATEENCFFLDDKSYIFANSPTFSDDVYFVYLIEPAFENPIGETYLPVNEFIKLPLFIKSLNSLNLFPRALVTTSKEYYFELTGGGKIIINRADDLIMIKNNLESFLTDQEEARNPNFIENISYIDLRFGNKVFYKLKGE